MVFFFGRSSQIHPKCNINKINNVTVMNEENFLHQCKMSVWSFWLKTFFDFQQCFLITWNLAIFLERFSLEKGPTHWKSASAYLRHTYFTDLRKGQSSVHGCRFLRAEVRKSQRYPTSSWTSQNQASPHPAWFHKKGFILKPFPHYLVWSFIVTHGLSLKKILELCALAIDMKQIYHELIAHF